MQCVILAGGMGTRMWPETATIPKTLLPVAGLPFASWQLSWLAASGITSVLYCVGHFGEQVQDYVGDGVAWGVEVRYVIETEQLLGTAGALRLAYDEGELDEDFLVLYGDSWLQIDPVTVLRAARDRAVPALMTVHRNNGQWDASNVVFDGRNVIRYEKGLADRLPEMNWIDYGLLYLQRRLIADRVGSGLPSDLAPLCTALSAEGKLAGYEVKDRFYEIGSPEGRAELDEFIMRRHAAGSGTE